MTSGLSSTAIASRLALRCQWFKHRDKDWRSVPPDARMAALREQTGCGHDDAEETTGLVAYVAASPQAGSQSSRALTTSDFSA